MDDLEAARAWARAYCRWRCNGLKGRGKLDPVYVEETEGRDQKAFWDHYSSCGDLSQGLAYALGVRTPYVNRKAMPGGWRPGRNLIDFYDGRPDPTASPALAEYVQEHGCPAIPPPADYAPAAGDLGFVWSPGQNNAHTFVFGTLLADGRHETFNYGAGGMSRSEFPGGKQSNVILDARHGGLWINARKLQFVVRLERLLADSSGLPNMAGEVIDELEARVP